jgi:putative redox protein
MPFETVTFQNANGDDLAARLDLPPDRKTFACALFAHCFTCSKNLKAVGAISKALNRQGIAVLRFDFTGLGESEGDFANTNFSSNVDDLVIAAEFMAERMEAPAILVGHSLGGAAVLQAAHRIPSAKAVATIGAPADPQHVTHLLADSREEIEANGQATVTLAGRSFTIKKQFLDDLEGARMESTIRGLDRALMIFHAPLDETVGIENAARIFEAAKHPKSFVSLDDADHLLSNEADSDYVGTVLGAWSRKYIGAPREAREEVHPEDNEVVTRTGKGLRTEIMAGGHGLVADEPESLGGTNTGPTPYDLLSAALGACTSMTMRMYADHKGWPLEEATVYLKHAKIHAEDCEHCETKKGKVDRITRELEVKGNLDQAQRERLTEIANRCPVHRTLHGEIDVVTRLRD